jgi:UDPglucose 6-dehydrogenase
MPVFKKLKETMEFLIYINPTMTELIKYTHNCFLATKVELFNEIYDVCQKVGVSYPNMMQGVHAIGKVGENHTRVPGPDGKRGYGGVCFPKDMKAFIGFARQIGLILPVLEAGMYGNTPRRDDVPR